MDIEKVIKGLECCTRLGCHHGCEYKSNGYSAMTCRQELEKDALALLKEQENDIHHMRLIIDEFEKEKQRNPVIVCPHCGKRVK